MEHGLSKRTTARWFVRAWLAAVLCGAIDLFIGRGVTRPSTLIGLLGLVAVASVIVVVAMWVAALVDLAHQGSWTWFLVVLLLFLLSLGALGLIAILMYWLVAPSDEQRIVVVRPSTT